MVKVVKKPLLGLFCILHLFLQKVFVTLVQSSIVISFFVLLHNVFVTLAQNRIVLQKVFVTLVLCLRYLGTMSSLPWHKTPFIPFFHVVFAFLIILTILTSPPLSFAVEGGLL